MTAAIIVSLLFSGLFCSWVSLSHLIRIEEERRWARRPQPVKEEPEEEKPRLTRLGRPIEEIRLGA